MLFVVLITAKFSIKAFNCSLYVELHKINLTKSVLKQNGRCVSTIKEL